MKTYYRNNGNIDFIGLSSETKPTEKIVNGSTFYEVDTTKLYMFYDGIWYEQ